MHEINPAPAVLNDIVVPAGWLTLEQFGAGMEPPVAAHIVGRAVTAAYAELRNRTLATDPIALETEPEPDVTMLGPGPDITLISYINPNYTALVRSKALALSKPVE